MIRSLAGRFGTFVAFAVAASAAPVHASQMSFLVVMNAGQEVPPVTDSNGQGLAHVTLDTATREVCYSISFDGLSGPAIAMHFHGPAAAGVNAGIAVDLSSDVESPIAGCVGDLTTAQMSDMKDGLFYLNVHTGAYPGGEIRGQVERVGSPRPSRGAGRLPVR